MSCVFDAVEVVDSHLRVALLESLEMALVVIVGLFTVNVLHWFDPLLGIILNKIVLADIVVPLECQQLEINKPLKASLFFDDISLQQRSDFLSNGVLINIRVNCAQFLSEINAVKFLQHVSSCLVGRILLDWIGGNVDYYHSIDILLNSR